MKKSLNVLIAESDTIKMSSTDYVIMFRGWNRSSKKYFIQMLDITTDGKQIAYEEYTEAEDSEIEYTFYKNILELLSEND